MDTEAHLIELEKALLTFDVRHSVEKLQQLLSPDFKEIGAAGAYFGLAEVLAALPTEDSWSAQVQNFEYRVLNEGICQLIYKAFVKHHDQDQGTYSLRTSIWRKAPCGWQMVFHQGTQTAPFTLEP